MFSVYGKTSPRMLVHMNNVCKELLSPYSGFLKTGGMASHYNYKLPWIPQRKKGTSGIFLTLIPEDSGEILTTYLKFARFKKENIAKSLQSELIKINQKVWSSMEFTYFFVFFLCTHTF